MFKMQDSKMSSGSTGVMSDTNEKLDRTNELLEKLIAIQEDVQASQVKLLVLYQRALAFGVIAFVTLILSITSIR